MKVLVAMSGGVDSSVAAALLIDQGHTVAGITMATGYYANDGSIVPIGETSIRDAASVCKHLGIPHYTIDVTDSFDREIITPFCDEYANGRTPNPCVICNRKLKFGMLVHEMNRLGYEKIATGHYTKIQFDGVHYSICKADDPLKDQSYFLYSIDQSALSKIIFPLSNMTKTEIRKIALEKNIPVAQKSDSQDVCFIKGDYRDFLAARGIRSTPGKIINHEGKVIGEHNGIPFYTIGQRRGLGVSAPAPLYVTEFRIPQNEIVLGYKEELLSRGLIADSVSFLTDMDIAMALYSVEATHASPLRLTVKLRYAHKGAAIRSLTIEHKTMTIIFDTAQEAVTPGQSAVLYHGDCVVGGGIIREAIPISR